ncbi:MAG TPA: hypothetical protein VH857_11110 [Actinomycetes bacterium]|nr:hypothetical protein [Actinomycetes bacterium]
MAQAPDPRSAAQVSDEQATARVSAVLTNLDWTIERAGKGLRALRKDGSDESRNAELVLTDLLAQLKPLRKRFFQDSYFPPTSPPTPPGCSEQVVEDAQRGGDPGCPAHFRDQVVRLLRQREGRWSPSVAQDDAELVRRLTTLNREIAEGGRPYAPSPTSTYRPATHPGSERLAWRRSRTSRPSPPQMCRGGVLLRRR